MHPFTTDLTTRLSVIKSKVVRPGVELRKHIALPVKSAFSYPVQFAAFEMITPVGVKLKSLDALVTIFSSPENASVPGVPLYKEMNAVEVSICPINRSDFKPLAE